MKLSAGELVIGGDRGVQEALTAAATTPVGRRHVRAADRSRRDRVPGSERPLRRRPGRPETAAALKRPRGRLTPTRPCPARYLWWPARPGCRCRTASLRSASSSRSPAAASSTGTAAVCTTKRRIRRRYAVALDLLSSRLQGLASLATPPAWEVHGALLPRRGDGVRGGHRPCALCRRADYDRFSSVWLDLHGEQGADTIDERLHAERVDPETRRHRLHEVELGELPDGAFVLHEDAPSSCAATRS